MAKELPKAYEPQKYEDKIYKTWEESGFFNPDNLDLPADAPTYSIVMPPPNRTGTLHMGHAAMLAIEDILIRFNRMRGKRALWVPGTDHAAIATQTKVEKILREEGTDRHQLGREKFLKRVVDFAQDSHDTIIEQIKKMGSSCDWSREAYTLDDIRSKAVRSVFKMMYDDGLIYRGKRIVNWCPRCSSTLSDDEVEYKPSKTKLYWIKYGPFILATTRPETKLGDTAVAVYPGDERYKDMVGKKYKIPGVLGEFEIVVVADRAVDPNFGSGAIKVTPAHDFADFDIAQRNNVGMRQIINEEGRMMENCGKYAGMTTKEAREVIVKDMEAMGLIDHIDEDYEHNMAVCYRCGTQIEPIPSLQWFIDVNKKINKHNKSIKELSLDAVKTGVFDRTKIKIIPERFEKNYYNWMENLRDWCISRQIWFGHQIPVWYKKAKQPIDITYFVHGTTVDNENHKASGHADAELSEAGIEQSKKLAELTKDQKFDVIFCSDLKRAVDSAKISFGDRKVKVIKDKRLRECDYGVMTQGKSEEVEKIEKDVIYKPFANGESYQDVENRIKDFLNDLIENYQGKKVAIVAHKGPQLALDVLINGKTWEQAFDEDWRKVKAWQPGWNYELKEINYVSVNAPEDKGWEQDPDTLDTWFSSGLWTFSTLAKSPNEIRIENDKLVIDNEDFKRFHPTQVLETGYDIIFFWVARMIIMTTYAIGDIPFEDVYLHGLVLDEKGKKMSKSKGNAIDPLVMCDKYGTDAARLSLVMGATPGNDTRLSEEKIAGFRNFVNKLWNVSRYVLSTFNFQLSTFNFDDKDLTEADRWILKKIDDLIIEITKNIEEYNFSQAGERLRDFTWNNLADWYLEVSKFEKNESKSAVISYVLVSLLKLWHPFIPFVTEAIWQEMGNKDLLMIAKWPEENINKNLEALKINVSDTAIVSEASNLTIFDLIKEIVTAVRNARAENKVEPAKKIKAVIYAGDKKGILGEQSVLIKSLRTGIEELEIKASGDKIDDAIFATVNGIEIYLIGAIDKDKEKARLKKEITKLEEACVNIVSKLTNNEFADRAPENIVKQEKERLAQYRSELEKLKERLKKI